MEKSTSIKNIAAALMVFHLKVDKIPKDAKNPFYNSKYATLSNILETISIPLDECGLTFAQFPTGENGLCTILMHAGSGEFMQAEYFMHLSKSDPQAVGSAITYQRRYALASILGLNIDDDDDDANSTVPKQEAKTNGQSTNDKDKPWLNKDTKEYSSLLARLKAGTATIEKARQYFKISKVMQAELEKQIPLTIKDAEKVPF